MTSSDDDRSGMNRSERDQSILDLVGGPGDEAVRAALLDLASLAEAPAPAPNDALAAVFDARPGPQRTRRSPGRIAGGTTAFVGLLVASGTAAAALGGGIPWIDDEPAAPRAVAARPSDPAHRVASGPYADATRHARTSPRATRQAPGTLEGATEPVSARTTGSPTDLPRAAFRAAARERSELTRRSTKAAATDPTSVADPKADDPAVEDPTVPPPLAASESPELPTDTPSGLAAGPADLGQPAQLGSGPGPTATGKPAKDTATLKPLDRGQGNPQGSGQANRQGKPAKVAKPVTPQGKPPTEPEASTPALSASELSAPELARPDPDPADVGSTGPLAQP